MTVLPRLLVLTDRRQSRRPLVETVAAAVAGGARAVVLREKDLGGTERAALANRLWQLLAPVGGLLISASCPATSGTSPGGAVPPTAAHSTHRSGEGEGGVVALHLAVGDPLQSADIVGRSCHNVAEVDAASDMDYVTVSPVFPTASKPGYGPPLGLDGLAALCARTPVPVYALGGVTRGNAAVCLEAGATGVAVMGDVMRADDPAAVVSGLLDAIRPRGPAPVTASRTRMPATTRGGRR